MVTVGGLVPAVAVASACATSIPLQASTRLDALRVHEKAKPGNEVGQATRGPPDAASIALSTQRRRIGSSWDPSQGVNVVDRFLFPYFLKITSETEDASSFLVEQNPRDSTQFTHSGRNELEIIQDRELGSTVTAPGHERNLVRVEVGAAEACGGLETPAASRRRPIPRA